MYATLVARLSISWKNIRNLSGQHFYISTVPRGLLLEITNWKELSICSFRALTWMNNICKRNQARPMNIGTASYNDAIRSRWPFATLSERRAVISTFHLKHETASWAIAQVPRTYLPLDWQKQKTCRFNVIPSATWLDSFTNQIVSPVKGSHCKLGYVSATWQNNRPLHIYEGKWLALVGNFSKSHSRKPILGIFRLMPWIAAISFKSSRLRRIAWNALIK